MAEALQQMQIAQAELLQNAQQSAKESDDPKQRMRLLDSISELEKLLPLQKDAAIRCLRAPNDPKQKADLKETNVKLRDALDEISETLRPGAATASAVAEEEKKIEQVKQAAERGDQRALEEALAELLVTNEKLKQKVQGTAKRTDDPMNKLELLNSLAELEKLLPYEVNAAKRVAQNPKDKKARKDLDEITDRTKVR